MIGMAYYGFIGYLLYKTYKHKLTKLILISLIIIIILLIGFSRIYLGVHYFSDIVVGFLIWTIALALFVCIDVPEMWLIFIVAIPLQVLDILWFLLRKVKKQQRIFK